MPDGRGCPLAIAALDDVGRNDLEAKRRMELLPMTGLRRPWLCNRSAVKRIESGEGRATDFRKGPAGRQ